MTIFEWVHERLSKVYRISEKVCEPTQMLLEAGAPYEFSQLFKNMPDDEYSLKSAFDGCIPDLESRNRQEKRNKGQYYTPESLAERMILGIGKIVGDILDPACGDGSFLLSAAKHYPLKKLYGYDIDLYALLICAVRLVSLFPGQGWPNLELRNFLLDRPNMKFSAIVGNPPYKVNLDESYKNMLKRMYKTAEGEQDLYTFFFEASAGCLEKNGMLSMVSSHTWLVNHQCKKIREFVFKNTSVLSIGMLPPRFFSFAPGVLGSILTARNSVTDGDYGVTILSAYSDCGWNSSSNARISQLINGTGLRESIIPEKLKECFDAMESGGISLGSACRVGVGIQEAVKKNGASSQFVCDEAKDDNYKPVLKGREIEAFRINWEKKYIHFGSHLAYAGKEEIYKNIKILYQNIRNEKLKTRLVATLDKSGFYFKNSLSYIISNDKKYSMELLTGLINSVLVNAWFAGRFHGFHITVTQVRQIPLPVYDKKCFEQIEREVRALLRECYESERERHFNALNKYVISAYLGNDSNISLKELEDFLTRAASL